MEIALNTSDQDKLMYLNDGLCNSRTSTNKATYTTWLPYFEMGIRKEQHQPGRSDSLSHFPITFF